MRRMPWTGLCFLIGALAISGLPLLNGFPSEWLTFQALLQGFTSTPGLVRLNFPLTAALLALTSALAAMLRAGIRHQFSRTAAESAASEAHESPAVMLVPLGFLATLCVILGLFPGSCSALSKESRRPCRPAAASSHDVGRARHVVGVTSFDHVVPAMFGLAFLGGLIGSTALTDDVRWPSDRLPRGDAVGS